MNKGLAPRIAAATAACLLLLTEAASADTVSYSSGFFQASLSIDADESGDFSFGKPVDVTGLPKFDPALGTLTGISFAITTGTFGWEASLDGEPDGSGSFVVEFDGSLQADVAYVSGGSGSVLAGAFDSVNVFCAGEPEDFCFEGNGNFFEFPNDGFTVARTPEDFVLADIVGAGDVDNLRLGINLFNASFVQNEGMSFFFLSGTATLDGISVEVTYTFDALFSDADGDGIPDSTDNCTIDANPLQIDSNGDSIGNVCDADIASAAGPGADDCTVNFFDLGRMKEVFFTSDPDADLFGPGNSEPDGTVNFVDLGRMKSVFFAAPGPSADGCN